MAKTNASGGNVRLQWDTFIKDFFPKLKNYEIKLKKERTPEQCPEFVFIKNKIKKGLYYGAKLF